MVIDFHCHIGTDKDGEGHTAEELLAQMDQAGIERSVIFPFNRPDEELLTDSLKILEYAKQNPKFIPFMRVNPKTVSKEKFTELLDKGFRGLKLHPNAQQFFPNNKEHFWIYEEMQKRNLPILFHSKLLSGASSDPKHLLEVADAFPDLKIVMGHFFGDVLSVVEEVKKRPNIFVETSIYSRSLRIKLAIERHGYDRLILGSDSPYDHPKTAKMKIELANLDEKMTRKILYENAKVVLGEA